jgi:hypothetical protein
LLDNVEGEVTHCDSDNDLGIFLDFSSLSLVESDADSCDTETTNEESEIEEECDKWSFVGEEMNTEGKIRFSLMLINGYNFFVSAASVHLLC